MARFQFRAEIFSVDPNIDQIIVWVLLRIGLDFSMKSMFSPKFFTPFEFRKKFLQIIPKVDCGNQNNQLEALITMYASKIRNYNYQLVKIGVKVEEFFLSLGDEFHLTLLKVPKNEVWISILKVHLTNVT